MFTIHANITRTRISPIMMKFDGMYIIVLLLYTKHFNNQNVLKSQESLFVRTQNMLKSQGSVILEQQVELEVRLERYIFYRIGVFYYKLAMQILSCWNL